CGDGRPQPRILLGSVIGDQSTGKICTNIHGGDKLLPRKDLLVVERDKKGHCQQLVSRTRGTSSSTRQLITFVFVGCRDHHFNMLACKPLSLSGVMATYSCCDFGMCRHHAGNDSGIDGDAIEKNGELIVAR